MWFVQNNLDDDPADAACWESVSFSPLPFGSGDLTVTGNGGLLGNS